MSKSSRHFFRQSTYFLITIISIFTAIILLSFQRRSGNPPEDNLDFLKQNFARPDKQYGTAPLWVWNTEITKAEIDSDLTDFKKQGFGGVFVHPRPSLITEYLSPEWNKLYAYTVKKGKELGLQVWIYDENSYPSGFAGGHVPNQMPVSYNQGQMLALTKATVLPDTASKFFLCLKEENGAFKDITQNLLTEKGKTGRYYLFYKNYYKKNDWTAGFPYVDLMVKGVTEKFIEVTMKGYERDFGNEFGKTVPGIFTDEPTIKSEINKNIRWTPDLFSYFQQKWGYSLVSNLPSLFEEIGDWKKVRHNYFQTLLQLYIDRWSKPYSTYAAKKGLEWTGHYYEHNWPNPIHGPDHMAMYAWHQRPAIDMLFNEYNEKGYGPLREVQFGNIRAVKELASVANQLSKKRTLCEGYAGGGWEISMKNLKRLGDWQYALGVNTMNQHLAHMSINGARKADYPQSFSYHNPWFSYYGEQNQYYARLSLVLSKGQQRNDILIIEPTTSAWMYTFHGGTNDRLTEITKAFPAFVVQLEKSQAEYDLGSENIIRDHGKVENGKFIIGQRAYTTVVLPPGMENLDAPTFKLLQEYAKQGGKILQFEKLQFVDGAKHSGVQTFNDAGGKFSFISKLNPGVIDKHFRSPDFSISALGDSIGGNLYHNRREMADGQILFLANASMVNSSKGKVYIKGQDALVMDAFSGEILDYPEVNTDAGHSTISFYIPPAGSLLLYVSTKKQSGFKKYSPIHIKNVLGTATASTISRAKENSLTLDFCDVKLGDKILKDQHVYTASNEVFKYNGFPKGNPWDFKVQFKSVTMDKNNFAKGTGFTATYHFNIGGTFDYSSFKAVIERAYLYSNITINGHTILPEKGQWWVDRSFGVLDIGKHLKPGINSLAYSADPMDVRAEVQAAYITGNFNLQPAARGFDIVAPAPLKIGGWKEQGLPMYGQNVIYKKTVKLMGDGQKIGVQLGDWRGTVVSVRVNGKEAGIIAYDPYLLDISNYITKGNNSIEVNVVGSLKNVMGPFYGNPAKGYIGPGAFRKSAKIGGKTYDLDDYGLMEDFRVVELSN